ncbi:hypothetical protein [Streptomyces goshikiensis]|uniref:hypothetical protein n=1 Tax=Streptomyces goshikiensis TaxID=1942 RepID=UPI00364BA653
MTAVPVGAGAPGLARRATADPLFRLVAYALETAHERPPAAVWSAPYAFHLGSPGLVAAAGWPGCWRGRCRTGTTRCAGRRCSPGPVRRC